MEGGIIRRRLSFASGNVQTDEKGSLPTPWYVSYKMVDCSVRKGRAE